MQHNSPPLHAMMTRPLSWLRAWLSLYVDGFRQMTWGRQLWALIFVKLLVMFVILRLFFFQPYLSGSDAESAATVGTELLTRTPQSK